MLVPQLDAALHAVAPDELTPEELAPVGVVVNSHTFLGLGLIAGALVVMWLIRRLRA